MKKATSRHEQFSERRAEMSTRFSARGHRFEQSIDETMQPFYESIPAMIQTLRLAEAAVEAGNADAVNQVNRIRGRIGNLKNIFSNPLKISTADLFMTIARETLPPEFFDAILSDVRAVRAGLGLELAKTIEKALETV